MGLPQATHGAPFSGTCLFLDKSKAKSAPILELLSFFLLLALSTTFGGLPSFLKSGELGVLMLLSSSELVFLVPFFLVGNIYPD